MGFGVLEFQGLRALLTQGFDMRHNRGFAKIAGLGFGAQGAGDFGFKVCEFRVTGLRVVKTLVNGCAWMLSQLGFLCLGFRAFGF